MQKLISELNKNKTIFVVWLLFLIALSFASLFTTNIPSTILIITHNFFSFLLFILMMICSKSSRSRRLLMFFIIGISIIFLSISVYFYLQPQQAKLLPFDNMFYPTFGHNHLAEWLLIVLPLCWWLALEKKKTTLYVLPILFTLALWFSYGRIVTSLGLLELLVIVGLYAVRRKKRFSSKLKVTFVVVLFGFISVLLAGTVLSSNDAVVCSNVHIAKLLCKPTNLSNRTYYWQQAIDMWQANPIFGTGLGTFYNASLQYVQMPGFQSAYAHNAILHLLAETGLVGTIPFVLLFSHFLIRATRVALNEKTTLAYILLIAVYASCVNALLDFSWSYKSIFYLTLLFIAMLLSLERQPRQKVPEKAPKWGGFIILLITICGSIAGVIAGGYLCLTIVTSLQLAAYPDQIPNTYMKYLKQYKKEYTKLAIAGSDDEKKVLFRLYDSDQDVLRELLLSAKNEVETNLYQKQMFSLDPWYALAFFDAKTYLQSNSLDQVVEQVDSLIDFINQKKENYKYIPRYETEIDFATSVLVVADQLFKRGEYIKAAQYYSFAQGIEPWIISKHDPIFLNVEVSIEQTDFVRTMHRNASNHYGQNQAVYGNAALQLFRLNFDKGEYEKAKEMLDITLSLLPWNKWKIWDEVLKKISDKANRIESNEIVLFLQLIVDQNHEEFITYTDYQLRKTIAQQLQERAVATARNDDQSVTIQHVLVMQKIFGDDYWVATQLGNYYISIGELDKASQAFDTCLQQFSNHHDDCFGGKQSILNGTPNKERFNQVSQIILGQKRWQDFQ